MKLNEIDKQKSSESIFISQHLSEEYSNCIRPQQIFSFCTRVENGSINSSLLNDKLEFWAFSTEGRRWVYNVLPGVLSTFFEWKIRTNVNNLTQI